MGLFKGKKPAIANTPTHRTVRPQSAGRPDFVYYANRRTNLPSSPATDGVSERPRSLLNAPSGGKSSVSDLRRRPLFWVATIVAVAVIIQLTFLGSGSRLAVIGSGADAGTVTAAYKATVDRLLAKSVLNRSKITIDTRGVAAELMRLHPEIESAVITLPLLGGQPTVHIAVSEPVFVVQEGSNRYVLSDSGYITRVATAKSDHTLVYEETIGAVAVGRQLLPRSTVQFMKTVQYQFGQTDHKIAAYVLPAQKAYEIDVRLEGKPYSVRFNLQEDPLRQSGAAIATIDQLGDVIPAAYLDVRVPGRVYYK